MSEESIDVTIRTVREAQIARHAYVLAVENFYNTRMEFCDRNHRAALLFPDPPVAPSAAPPTPKEIILVQRQAFAEGVSLGAQRPGISVATAETEARHRYPFPSVQVPRIVADPHDNAVTWCATNGDLVWRRSHGLVGWRALGEFGYRTTKDRIGMWADLLQRPTVPNSGSDET